MTHVEPEITAKGAVVDYASNSTQERRVLRRQRRAALWCGVSGVLWIIVAAMRIVVSISNGFTLGGGGGEFRMPAMGLMTLNYGVAASGDVLTFGASVCLALATAHVRRGEKVRVKRALGMVLVQVGAYVVSLVLFGVYLAANASFFDVIPLTVLAMLGLVPFVISLVTVMMLAGLLRRGELQSAGDPRAVATMRQMQFGRACFGIAVAHLIATAAAVVVGMRRADDQLAWMMGCVVLGTMYVLMGVGIQRGSHWVAVMAAVLLAVEVLMWGWVGMYALWKSSI